MVKYISGVSSWGGERIESAIALQLVRVSMGDIKSNVLKNSHITRLF